jgi:hypothetical protein
VIFTICSNFLLWKYNLWFGDFIDFLLPLTSVVRY